MSKTYVPNSISEYLGESKSITLKRKYGERPTITAGTQAPLRNQVLSFVAENASVSKLDLKRFIVGLKEGGSTPAAANMFIKRNAKYFVTESKGGVTYFKLSQLGERLVNQFQKPSPVISESKEENPISKRFKGIPVFEKFVEDEQIDGPPEMDELPVDPELPSEEVEFEEDDRFEDDITPDAELDDMDEVPEDEDNDDNFEYYEDDEKIVLTYYKTGEETEDDEPELEPEEDDELGEEDLEDDEDLEDVELDESDEDFNPEGAARPHDEPREFDFKDKGRPGIHDMEESEQPKTKLEKIIENIKAARAAALNEAEPVADTKDELSDTDLNTPPAEEETPEEDDLNLDEPVEEEVEKVEITEFIITVDNVDSAIDELQELGVTAERVPVEPKEQEVPAELPDEEPPVEDEPPVDNIPEKPEVEKPANESVVNEADDELDLGASDDLSLGDQGEKADDLDLDAPEETVEPTTEFEENKLKVKAEDWPTLKGWLEDKGVDVTEMFGGEIEMEEVSDDIEDEVGNTGPVSDDDVDFSGIGDEDKTQVTEKPEEE